MDGGWLGEDKEYVVYRTQYWYYQRRRGRGMEKGCGEEGGKEEVSVGSKGRVHAASADDIQATYASGSLASLLPRG